MTAFAASRKNFPDQGFIHDRAGQVVDGSGWLWRLNDITGRTSINWEEFEYRSTHILESAVCFIRSLIEASGSESVRNAFSALSMVAKIEAFREAIDEGDIIPFSLFTHLRGLLGSTSYRLHYIRQWYCWSADRGYYYFSPDVAFEICRLRIGGNEKGRAVLSSDPNGGPLDDLEVAGLLNALRAASISRLLSRAEQAALWLCIALGSNPLQLGRCGGPGVRSRP